ncbi:hypothetical protein A1332_13425 [Methylomonas methanica]|uniref:Uncharacterized protein n=1 Tax=Methylomonas methanica TaxID=421 RepID=A0A177MHR6_METMH|nr:hypothetical protein A1332_13425 [Methylomonas methanica]
MGPNFLRDDVGVSATFRQFGQSISDRDVRSMKTRRKSKILNLDSKGRNLPANLVRGVWLPQRGSADI